MIYRLETIRDDGVSEGFEFFPSQAATGKRVMYLRSLGYKPEDFDVDSAETPKTKTEIISLLTRWGAHGQNERDTELER